MFQLLRSLLIPLLAVGTLKWIVVWFWTYLMIRIWILKGEIFPEE